ncbi:MAG: TlyA family RNA methyltransferase [Sphaerochaetaceae bacterium]|nr:TlyA family RNA methyltransferase [Spirochaetales bacterium]MDY5500888.1 TlyA family RNA methyltransferase [Sphaerochaetaceae bacterium]
MKKRALIDLLAVNYPDIGREKLGAYIVCRNVLAGGEVCADPKMKFPEDVPLSFTFEKYVSRGGYKLEHALKAFHLDVSGMCVLDAGSSTGGFTDCLLQHGASLVHSVDVGTNQLSWKLRQDDRVRVHERQNIMTLDALDPAPQAAVCDLSFRSISGAAGHILSLCGGSWLVSLIKPQFEVPKGQPGFHGVVTDPQLLRDVLLSVYRQLSDENIAVRDIVRSPITGRKGNTEYLALLGLDGALDEPSFLAKL